MNEFIEIFKDFDMNNIGMLMVVSIVLISMAASYVQLLHASRIEAVLMNKSEEIKRFLFLYIIMFFVLCVTTYLLTISAEAWMLSTSIWAGIKIVTFLLSFTKKGWRRRLYWWFEERKDAVVMITATAAYTYIGSLFLDISRMSCVILGALIAVFIVAMTFLNVGNVRASVTVTIENEKWYVFKRIDEKNLLCGNQRRIDESTKTKLLSIEKIVEQNICFGNEDS